MKDLERNDIMFGAAYYPEYMPYERLQEDIAMMQEAGMNTVRIAESTWSTLEPVEGKFDFSYIDKVLAAVEKAGMYAVIGTPTYAIPSWLEKKCPEVMVFDGYTRAKYGRRQIMDIVHPVFRQCAENVIYKLLEHTAKNPCVIGFQIDNETKHYGTASPEVQAMFVEYLKEQFHTTERLNDVFGLRYWSNSIHDWSDFPDMAGCIHGGLASEFAKFAYEKGCLPVVPHLYFPQFLKESDVQERMAGIQFGLSLLKECREVWVFGEVMSEGMCMEIAEADHAGIPIRYFTKQNGEFVERSSL